MSSAHVGIEAGDSNLGLALRLVDAATLAIAECYEMMLNILHNFHPLGENKQRLFKLFSSPWGDYMSRKFTTCKLSAKAYLMFQSPCGEER